MSEQIITKLCYKCGETKAVSEFHRCRAESDGLQRACKGCRIAYNATPKVKERWKARQQTPEYKARNQTPEYKAYRKAYNSTPEVQERAKVYYFDHRDKILTSRLVRYYDNRLDALYPMAVRKDSKKNRTNRRKPNPEFKLNISANLATAATG